MHSSSMLKPVFSQLSLREKVLVTLFLWSGILVWLTFSIDRVKDFLGGYTSVNQTLEKHQFLFDKQPEIESRLKGARDRFDPVRTVSSNELIGKIDAIARQSHLSPDITAPRTQDSDIFDIHTLRVRFKDASISDLIQFSQELKKEFPYIALESLQIKANKKDPARLNALFVITSFESKEKI